MSQTLTCPNCNHEANSDSPTVHVEFAPVGARVQLDGSIELGSDFWLDFKCLQCGCKFRFSRHLHWNDEAFEYLPDPSKELVEIDPNDDPYDWNSGEMVPILGDLARENLYVRLILLLEEAVGEESS